MGAPKRYNGHHCYACWNVALWLGNDEGLYNAAMHYVNLVRNGKTLRTGKRREYTFTKVASMFKSDYGLEKTPDGAVYSIKALTSALKGLAE